jgi:hypothetical protein
MLLVMLARMRTQVATATPPIPLVLSVKTSSKTQALALMLNPALKLVLLPLNNAPTGTSQMSRRTGLVLKGSVLGNTSQARYQRIAVIKPFGDSARW